MDPIRKIDNVNAYPAIGHDDKIKISSSENSGNNEFCLNSTGIIVAIAMFIIVQGPTL